MSLRTRALLCEPKMGSVSSLEIESTPGKGTTILARIAVPARAGEMVDHA